MRKRAFLYIMVILLCSCTEPEGRIHSDKKKGDSVSVCVDDAAIEFSKPTFCVYIENSGSMDGYVKGVTQFEQSVYSYLSDIKISGITDTLNLFYINSQVIQQGSDIEDFIKKLEPTTFKKKGGDRGTSDISDVIKTILKATDGKTVALLVSDCIFSPGRGKDAEQYLVNQQIGIKKSMADFLKSNDCSIMFYQLSSQFDGFYYNREDKPTKIKEQRPFYMWIIGKTEYVAELRNRIPDNKIKGSGVQNVFTISQGNKSVNYAVVNGSGNFRLDRKNPKTNIVDAKKESRGKGDGKLTVSVNVDLSAFLLDDSYICDVQNWELNDKDFKLESVHKSLLNGYSHILKFASNIVKPTTLSAKLKMSVPQWVYDQNDEEGVDIRSNGAMRKTFGIKYQVEGVYEAFTANNNVYYTSIKININK